jgi:hypothetical protein
MCGLGKLEILLVTSNFAGVFVRDHNFVIRTSPAQNDNNSNTMLCAVCCCFVRGNMVDK